MKRIGLVLASASLLSTIAGCFSSQPTAEDYRDQVLTQMERGQVRFLLGEPKDIHPIPGQGEAAQLPVEQWRYEWNHPSAKTLTIVVTLGFGLIWMDRNPYGFDVGFARDGKVCIVSDVLRLPR